MAFGRLRSATKKEFRLFFRDRRLLPVMFIIPVVQLVILGYGATLDIKSMGAGVLDMDMTPRTRRLVSAMEATGYFKVKMVSDPHLLYSMMDRGDIVIGVILPQGFSSGKNRSLQVLVDASNTSLGQTGLYYFTGLLLRSFLLSVPLDDRVHIMYNPMMKSAFFMIPAVVALVLLIFTMLLTALAVVKEKEGGTLEQVMVTPMRPWEFVVSKTLPFVIVGTVQVSLVLAVAVLWFRIPFRGSLLVLACFSLVYLMSTLSLGLFISVIARTQREAMMTAYFIAPVLMIVSGFIVPGENMPLLSRVVSYLNPITHFLVALRDIFLKGYGFSELWPRGLLLLVYGSCLFAFSTWMVKKRVL